MSSIRGRSSFDAGHTGAVGSSEQLQSHGGESTRNSVDEQHGVETQHGLRSRQSRERLERPEGSVRPEGAPRRHTGLGIGSSSAPRPTTFAARVGSEGALTELASSPRHGGSRVSRHGQASARELRRRHERLVQERDTVSTDHSTRSRDLGSLEQQLVALNEKKEGAEKAVNTATGAVGEAEKQQKEARQHLQNVQEGPNRELTEQQGRVRDAASLAAEALKKQEGARTTAEQVGSALATTRGQLSQIGTQIETVQRDRTGLGEELGRLQRREREQQEALASAGQRLERARGNVASSASPAATSQTPASGDTAAAAPRPTSPAPQTRSDSPEAAQAATPTERPNTPRTELRESEERHRSATQALEATQKKIGEMKAGIGELDGKLERLGEQQRELKSTETRQSEALGKANEQLEKAKEAVKSTADVETAARNRLGEMKEEAAAKVGEAERQLAEASKLVETRNKELLGTKEALRSVTADIAQAQKAHEKLTGQVKSLEQRLTQLDERIDASSASIERQERRPTSPQATLFYQHPVLSRANLPRVQSEPSLPPLAAEARRGSASPEAEAEVEFEFTPATPGEMSRRGSELQSMELGSRLHAPGKSPLGLEGTLTVPKSESLRSAGESSSALSLTDVPHSSNINLKTLDGEAFALRNGTLYMWDNGTGTFYSELERVQQLKLGANGHAYARAGNSIFALTETAKQSNGIAARELPCPENSHILDFTVSPAGSVAYITQPKPTETDPEPKRELYWLAHGQDAPTRVPLPDNMGRIAGVACNPTGQVYSLDHSGEMWRGHIDDVLARAGGDTNAVGWRRMDVPHAVVPFTEITTLANGNIQASSAPRDGIPDGEPGKGPDNRVHFVLSLKDEWQPHENMSGNVLDLAYKDRLKNAAAERKARVTLGIGAGKRSGWDHEQPPSLVLRGANHVADFVQNRVVDPIATRAAQLPAPVRAVGRALGTVALPIATVAATHAIMPVGRAAWLARPVAALVPTMIRNRAAFHASPAPVQVPGFEAREAQSRGSRWLNFFSAAYGTQTERGARNANVRRELAVGAKLMQLPNAAIPPRPPEGGVDHHAVIRGDMVNKLVSNATTALDRIEKELGTLDRSGQPVSPDIYRNNELYQRFRFEAPSTLGKAAGAVRHVDNNNNVLHHLHRQAMELLQHTDSPQAQELVVRLHALMHVKRIHIPADERAGVKDLTGMGARDTAHAFLTTQLAKVASDLGHTFKTVKSVNDKLASDSAPAGPIAASRTDEVIQGMCREAVARMDAPGEGRVNTEFNRYNTLADYATHTDPAIVEKQLVSELRTMRALPDDNRLSRLDAPQFEQLKKTYHDNTKLALDRFEAAIGLSDAFTAFQTTGTVPPTSKGAPYRQLQQRDQALVWSNENALFDLYKRRMVALHGADPADVGPPGATPPEGARGDIPLHEAIPIRQPAAEGELTARIEFLLRQGIHVPVEAPKTKPMEPNTAPQPIVRGLWQKGPTPAADKAAHPDVNAPQGVVARAKNWFTSLRSTVVNSGLDVLLGQMVRCQLVAEEAAQEVARKSRTAAPATAQPSSSTAPAAQDDTIRSATTQGTPAPTVPAEELADIATRSSARIAGGKDNPAGALFEKGVVASTVERVAEKLRIQQMIATHPDHIVTRAINMQGAIHPEDVEAFARMAWRSLPTGSTIRLDHTLHLGVDFDGLGFSFRFVNRQLQGAPESEDPSKNVLNIPLNSLFSFQPTPYFGQTKGSTVSLTKTTDGADIKMSNFTDREAKLLAGKLMWGAGRFGMHEAKTSDGKPSQDVLALIYWGFELLPNLLKISGRGTDELTFHLKNDNSGLAENAAVNILDRKASIDHLLEVCASLVETHKDSKSREHEIGFHPLAASVMIANRPDDKDTRFKAVAAGLIQAALTGTYSSEVEKTQGDGKVRTTTTAKSKSTNLVLKPIEVTELQFSKQWPWNSPVPIKGIQPPVGDGIEMEHKLPTWIRVGIINVFQHNGLACGITTAPDGKVESVSWGATTRHEFNDKSFPQLRELRERAPTAYKNMMTLAREAERANTPVNVNMELTPDALDRLNNCRSESESIRILKNADNYRIKSVSAGEEYRYDSGTFFGFDFFRMDHKGSNTLSNPARGLVEMVYPDPTDTRSAIEAKVRGEFTVGGGEPDFSRLDARLSLPEVENAILDVGVSKERVLLAMMAPQRATEATVRAVAAELNQPARATAGQDHFAMHNGEVVLRTRVGEQWHQAALTTEQLNLLLSTPPNAPERAPEPAGSRRMHELAPPRDPETRAGDSSAPRASHERSIDGSMTRSMEAGEEWRGELHAKQTELQRVGAQPWAQKVLQAMSAGASVSFAHDPQAVLGAATVQSLKDGAHHDATPASRRLDAGRPVYVGEIIRELHEAGGRAGYALDAAQQHVLATFFPGADGRFNAALVDQVLATDPYGFIRAADLIAGRVKPSLLARMDIPDVAAMGADRAPAPVPGVPVLGGISAGGS